MKSKHTNGPWKTERKNCCTHIVSESKKGIHGWQSHITTLDVYCAYSLAFKQFENAKYYALVN